MLATLDLAFIRSFVLIADGDGFGAAADKVHRSQSAVSLQIRRIEEVLGTVLFERQGRQMALTAAGERLLPYARRLLALNDETLLAFTAPERGKLNFGLTQDFVETLLPLLLKSFAARHPGIELGIRIDRSWALVDAVGRGELDVSLSSRRESGLLREVVSREKMVWIGSAGFPVAAEGPVPLALFEPPCTFRNAALDALEKVGREAKIVLTSPSLSGLRAAVEAGLGVTVRTRRSVVKPLQQMGAAEGLPELPEVEFCLYAAKSDISPAAASLMTLIAETI
jgi:DNA-binding transcriptional LysR family regulator